MAVYKRKDSPVFWAEFVFEGQRYRQSTGTIRRRKAEEFERLLRQRVYDEVKLGRRAHEPMRFEDAVKRYITTHLKTKVRLDKTALCDTYTLAKLTRLIGPDTLLDEITTERVANLKETIFDSGTRKPATANKYLAALRAILRMAHYEWKRLAELPRFKLYALKNERTRWLRPEEEVRLLRACEPQPHLRDLVVFLLDSGARLGEACRLTWDRVQLPKRGRGVVHLFSTKTQKTRAVPLTRRADGLLRRLEGRCQCDDGPDVQVAVGPAVQPAADPLHERVVHCGMADGAGNADRHHVALFVEHAFDSDDRISPQQFERRVGVVEADRTLLEHLDQQPRNLPGVSLEAELKCPPGRESLINAALLLSQDGLMKLQLVAPERLAPERVVTENLSALGQHLVGVLVDLVIELLLGELLGLYGRVGRHALGAGRARNSDYDPLVSSSAMATVL
jgi:integrase